MNRFIIERSPSLVSIRVNDQAPSDIREASVVLDRDNDGSVVGIEVINAAIKLGVDQNYLASFLGEGTDATVRYDPDVDILSVNFLNGTSRRQGSQKAKFEFDDHFALTGICVTVAD